MKFPIGMRAAPQGARHGAGFTLIEVLAVILIVIYLYMQVGGGKEAFREQR